MIALSWTFFALLALFWTAGAWMTAAATQWIAQAIASGTAAQAAREFAALPVPEWLAPWMDPAWLRAMQSAFQWTIETAGALLPLAQPAAGWIVPLIWIGWGAGMLLLMLGGLGVHVVLARLARRAAPRQIAGAA